MAGYDPVHEFSQRSPTPLLDARPSSSSSSSKGRQMSHAEVYAEDSQHTRRPSRSASLVDLLNPSDSGPPDRERPGSSSSSSNHVGQWGDQQQHPQGAWSSVEATSRGGSHRFSYDALREQPPQPRHETRQERSPSFRLLNIMNPSPGSVAAYSSGSRSGVGQSSKDRSGRGSPSGDFRREGYLSREGSTEAGQGHYLQPEKSSLQVQVRTSSYGSSGGSPLMNARYSGSPMETSPMGSHPSQQGGSQYHYNYASVESPRSSSFATLPPTSGVSPQLSHSAAPNGSQAQSYRSADGFRIPSLPSHRSPESRRVPLPLAIPSPSTSYSGSYDGPAHPRESYAHPLTPHMTSGSPGLPSSGAFGSAPLGHEYFAYRAPPGLPMTPGGRDVMSPVTPGVALTPGGQPIGDRARTTRTMTPTSVPTYSRSTSRGSATLSESNVRSLDQYEAPQRPSSSSRMSVDGLLSTAPSTDMQQGSKAASNTDRRRSSGAESLISSDRDAVGTKRSRPTTQESAVSHKRPKSSGRFRDTSAGIADAGRAPTSTETGEAKAATRNVEQTDGKLLGSGIATSPSITEEPAPAVKKAKSLTSVKADQGSNGHPSHTPSSHSISDSKLASTEGEASTARMEDNAVAPSTPSAASSNGGKVKLLEMDEMERLTSRDSKKRKSLSLAAPAEQPKSIKVDKSPASSLPAKPSFTNVASSISGLEPDQKLAGREGAQEPSADEVSGSIDEPLPYRPKHRVSAPDSIRRPLSQQDLVALHQTIEARGANTLRQKWVEQERAQGRDGADGFGQVVQTWGIKPGVSSAKGGPIQAPSTSAHSESEVARHYNSRQELGLQARNFSPILPLKNFNNWVKSVLIGSFGRRGGKAMDMGGGKGGDLQKWDKLGVRELVLADIAATSVDQAKARYLERRFRWKASFFALDCFGESLAMTLPPEVLDPPFDTVSLQFCMHYGWSTLQRARLVIENVSRYLDKGGVFIGTIPNAEELYSRRDRLGPDELGFGNGKYRVTFEQKEKRKPFGDRYTFFLDDAVDEVPEYVVDWDQFESLAKECGLSLIFKKPMAEVWEEFRHQHEFENLARRMKVSSNPRRDVQPMDDDLWEATTIYLAFAFEKIR